MKQLQDEAQKSREKDQRSNREMAQLRKQQRQKDNQIRTLETDKRQKELVLKRKLEEVIFYQLLIAKRYVNLSKFINFCGLFYLSFSIGLVLLNIVE